MICFCDRNFCRVYGNNFVFQQDNVLVHLVARATVELMCQETPEFIVPGIWPPNSPDLSVVDYEIWAVMQRHVYQRDFHSVDELKRGLLVSAVRSRTVNFIARQHTDARYENLYSPHNSDSSSDKIDTKYTTKIIKINLIRT